MARSYPQQRQRWTFWASAALLPVAQRVHADSHCTREPCLRQADEVSENRYVVSALELAEHQALAKPRGDGSGELLRGDFWNFCHFVLLAWDR